MSTPDLSSSCCGAPVDAYTGGEGTQSWYCTRCGKPCDAHCEKVATTRQCEARVPGWFGVWLAICEAPPTAAWVAGCAHDHVVTRWLRDKHAVQPRTAGCRQCFDAGHECEMHALGVVRTGPEFTMDPPL